MTEPGAPITADVQHRAVTHVEALTSYFFQHDWCEEDEDEAFNACVAELLEQIRGVIQEICTVTHHKIDAWSN
jgi:hypothetical protein